MATLLDQDALKDILLNNLGIESHVLDARPDITLNGLGVDSVALLELQVILHERFGVTVGETVGDLPLTGIVDFVNSAMAGAA